VIGRTAAAWLVVLACAGPDVSPPITPVAPQVDEPQVSEATQDEDDHGADDHGADDHGASPAEAAESLAPALAIAPIVAPPEPGQGDEVWLKGSTHVHAHASGDSSEPNARVIAWYTDRHYDFIVLTDHNRVSELEPASHTQGQVALRDPGAGLIVLSGIELTHNPVGCLPVGDPSRNCRIHVNLLGPTARPLGRIEWAERHSHARLDMYRAALTAQATLGGLAQVNHPQWLWGMTPDLLVELSRRGVRLVEIANTAFSKWNAGDAGHPSTEALWDAALGRGATLWGVASDDAHDYDGHGKYPPGGGWVVVRARRAPAAILEALAVGHFYSSNGVVLARADTEADELVVAVDPAATGSYTIDFIANGQHVARVRAKTARHRIPSVGYLRAVVTRGDGKRAWVQPVRLSVRP